MSERFIKTDLDLLAIPGLSSRLRELYGRLRLHAGRDGKCYPKWATLAREIGVKNPTTVYRLLCQLKALKLVAWKRHGQYTNQYRVLAPDIAFLQGQTLQKRNVSDIAELQPRKEGSSSKEPKKRNPSPTPPPPGAGTPRPKSPQKPAAPAPVPAATPEKTQVSNSLDDEKAKQPKSTDQELRERLEERHGSNPHFDVQRCVLTIHRQLSKCAGLTVADFLEFDATTTTAPASIRNPGGYYVNLAIKCRQEAVSKAYAFSDELLKKFADAAPPEPARDHRGLCTACGGPGTLPDGKYCTCPMGRDLSRLKKTPAEPPEPKQPKVLTFPRKKKTSATTKEEDDGE